MLTALRMTRGRVGHPEPRTPKLSLTRLEALALTALLEAALDSDAVHVAALSAREVVAARRVLNKLWRLQKARLEASVSGGRAA
jgi:hypothetical protein